MPIERIRTFLDNVGGLDALDEYASYAADEIKKGLEKLGPSPDHKENIYATGDSQKAWVKEQIQPGLYRLVNTEEYSYYAMAATTRDGGDHSAQPAKDRKIKDQDYMAHVEQEYMPDINEEIQRRIDDATG